MYVITLPLARKNISKALEFSTLVKLSKIWIKHTKQLFSLDRSGSSIAQPAANVSNIFRGLQVFTKLK